MPKGKPPSKPFKKGQPGGPGRPPGSRNGSGICKDWADRFGFDFLMRVAEGTELFTEKRLDSKGKETVTSRTPYLSERTQVATYLIDRAYGKPTAMHEVDLRAKLTLEQIITGSRSVD